MTEKFDLSDEAAGAIEIALEAVDDRAAQCNIDVSRAEILAELVAHATRLHAEAMGIALQDYLLDLAAEGVRGKPVDLSAYSDADREAMFAVDDREPCSLAQIMADNAHDDGLDDLWATLRAVPVGETHNHDEGAGGVTSFRRTR